MTAAADLPEPGDLAGWLVLYGPRLQHRALSMERGRAELQAAQLHGVVMPLVIGGPAELPQTRIYGLDQEAD